MLVITAATRPEAEAITRCLENRQKLPVENAFAWRGKRGHTEVLALQTGMGKQRVEKVIGPVLAAHPVTAVVSVGFGGALTPELRTGDLVICTATLCHDETRSVSEPPRHADKQLVRQATGEPGISRPEWIIGKSVTVPRLASTTAVRKSLRDRTQAEVCEMEDYWISRIAGARDIPFLAVRVVYDEFETELSDEDNLIEQDGNIHMFRALKHFGAHPVRFYKSGSSLMKYRRAKKRLADFVAGFLDAER
jgi:adenosylhomocysteine nucleosidase